MNKIIYSVIIIFLTLASCRNDENEENHTYQVYYVDLSGLSIYAGSESGPEKVQYNNLKRTELLQHYSKGLYNHQIYDSLNIQFNGNLMTYVYPKSGIKLKIVSKYTYRNDSLFAVKTDGSFLFAAVGNNRDSLYRQLSLVMYPYKTTSNTYRDTVVISDKPFNYQTDMASLPLAKYTSLDELKTSGDTIVWCNAKYLFQ